MQLTVQVDIRKTLQPENCTTSVEAVARGHSLNYEFLPPAESRRLLLDLGHYFSGYSGENICVGLPPLGSSIPGSLADCSINDGIHFFEMRSFAKHHVDAAGAGDKRSREIVSLLSSRGIIQSEWAAASIWRERILETTDGRGTTYSVGTLGYIRDYGALHRNALLTSPTFFVLDPIEAQGPFSVVGDVYGLQVVNGVVEAPALAARAAYLETPSERRISRLSLSDMELRIGEVTVSANTPGCQFFTRTSLRSDVTSIAQDSIDIAIVGKWALGAKVGGGIPVPAAGCVVRFSKNSFPPEKFISHLKLHSEVQWTMPGFEDLVTAFQAGPKLVEAGVVSVSDSELSIFEGGVNEYTPVPYNFISFIHQPRTKSALAIDKSGQVVLLIMDNAKLNDVVNRLMELDTDSAIMLDGGASSCLFLGSGAIVPNRDYRDYMNATWDRPFPSVIRLT